MNEQEQSPFTGAGEPAYAEGLFENAEREITYVKGSLSAWFAMRLWYDGGVSIFEAADKFGVTNDEVMESFEKNRPVAYHLFMARLTLALGLAGFLVSLHSRLMWIRNAIKRRIS